MSLSAKKPAPERRLRLVLDLGADDPAELVGALRGIAFDLELDDRPRKITSGGYACGYSLTLVEDPEMDGDRYRAALDEWVKDRDDRASR